MKALKSFLGEGKDISIKKSKYDKKRGELEVRLSRGVIGLKEWLDDYVENQTVLTVEDWFATSSNVITLKFYNPETASPSKLKEMEEDIVSTLLRDNK